MGITGLDHINIVTSRPEETIRFYEQVLGLQNRPDRRPESPRPGAWLFLDDAPIVHLNFIDDDGRQTKRSAFGHIAFEGNDFGAMCALLDEYGLEYRTSERPEIAVSQIFVNDPNGIMVEVHIRG